MIATTLRERQAEVLHALAEAGGALPEARAAAGEGALADLAAARLVTRAGGRVELGPRGSALSAADVSARLRTRALGRPLEIHGVLGSSNDAVLERAAAGAAPGLVIGAELQTAARGRRGASFDARPGLGLWLSVLLPAPDDPASAPRLSLLVALAVADAVEEVAGIPAGLKWPNDVRLCGRKVCGVLVEARSRGRALWPVAGIGMNVHHADGDFPAEFAGAAISVEAAAGRRVERGALLAALLARLEERLDAERAGGSDLAAAWAPRDELAGRDLAVERDEGVLEGRGAGVAPDGSLLVDVPGRGTIAVRAGLARVRERT